MDVSKPNTLKATEYSNVNQQQQRSKKKKSKQKPQNNRGNVTSLPLAPVESIASRTRSSRQPPNTSFPPDYDISRKLTDTDARSLPIRQPPDSTWSTSDPQSPGWRRSSRQATNTTNPRNGYPTDPSQWTNTPMYRQPWMPINPLLHMSLDNFLSSTNMVQGMRMGPYGNGTNTLGSSMFNNGPSPFMPPCHASQIGWPGQHTGEAWAVHNDTSGFALAQQQVQQMLSQSTMAPTAATHQSRTIMPRQSLIPVPAPTILYQMQAKLLPVRMHEKPHSLLCILDLNGVLIHRRTGRGSSIVPRPGLEKFLEYLLNEHFVMIWSSMTPENVAAIVDKITTAEQRKTIVAIWDRQNLRLGDNFGRKIQTYKQLSWVWEDSAIQENGRKFYNVKPGEFDYGQHNTVLIDDSTEKCVAEPFNHILVPEFTGQRQEFKRGDALDQVRIYLEELRWWDDVSSKIREDPFVCE